MKPSSDIKSFKYYWHVPTTFMSWFMASVQEWKVEMCGFSLSVILEMMIYELTAPDALSFTDYGYGPGLSPRDYLEIHFSEEQTEDVYFNLQLTVIDGLADVLPYLASPHYNEQMTVTDHGEVFIEVVRNYAFKGRKNDNETFLSSNW